MLNEIFQHHFKAHTKMLQFQHFFMLCANKNNGIKLKFIGNKRKKSNATQKMIFRGDLKWY